MKTSTHHFLIADTVNGIVAVPSTDDFPEDSDIMEEFFFIASLKDDFTGVIAAVVSDKTFASLKDEYGIHNQ